MVLFDVYINIILPSKNPIFSPWRYETIYQEVNFFENFPDFPN